MPIWSVSTIDASLMAWRVECVIAEPDEARCGLVAPVYSRNACSAERPPPLMPIPSLTADISPGGDANSGQLLGEPSSRDFNRSRVVVHEQEAPPQP